MGTTNTSFDHLSSSGQQQQASGRSLFWGVAAIALNAMVQPSFTGNILSRDVFENSLAPHRSSPCVCLTDAAADVWLITRRFRQSSNGTQDDRPRASPIAVSMRLATFLFGVLPQVIKIFSARGIPVTQAVVAGLFLSTIISMARTLHLVDGRKDLAEGQKDFTDLVNYGRSPDALEGGRITDNGGKVIIGLVAVLPHAIALSYVWTAIASDASIDLNTEDVANGASWIAATLVIMTSLYSLQQVVCLAIWKRYLLPASINALAVVATSTRTYLLLCLFQHDEVCNAKRKSLWLPLYFYVALGSYFLAWALKRVASGLFGKPEEQHERSSNTLKTNEEDGEIDLIGTKMMSILGSFRPSDTMSDDDIVRELADRLLAVHHEDSVQEGAPLDSTQRRRHSYPQTSPQLLDSHPITPRSPQSVHSPPAADPADPTTRSADVTINENRSSFNHDLPIWVDIMLFVASVFLLPIGLAVGLATGLADRLRLYTRISDELGAAEEGNASQHPEPRSDEIPYSETIQPAGSRFWRLLPKSAFLFNSSLLSNDGARLIVRYLYLTVHFLMKGVYMVGFSAWDYPILWVKAKLNENFEEDVVWFAFLILNVATTAMYYLLIFDGEGTYMPQWTNLLG